MSQQNIPRFAYSDHALAVRAFLYDFWSERGYGPNLRDIAEAVGLDRHQIVIACKQLNLGEIYFDLTTQNLCMIKCPPFSAVTTQVQIWLEDRFFAYSGCAMESVAVSRTPKLRDRDVTIESYCSCCLEPLTFVWRNGELQRSSHPAVLIHVSLHPDDWGIPSMLPMCDAMNFVIDTDHARRYEAAQSRRGVLFTLEQTRTFVGMAADHRMWEYDWYLGPLDPPVVFEGIRELGVDTSPWDGADW